MSKQKGKAATASAPAADPAPAGEATVLVENPSGAAGPDPGAPPDAADAVPQRDSDAPAEPTADAGPPAPPEGASQATATVRALVLSDGPFGRCGEVREFDAAHVSTIEAGGFIDTHPNAVASAEHED